MATIIRERATGMRSAAFIGRTRDSGRRPEIALSHLVDQLMIAFFVAVAVMWVVTTIAGIFG
jgi:hypothetical protein